MGGKPTALVLMPIVVAVAVACGGRDGAGSGTASIGTAMLEPALENLETAETDAEREARIAGLRRLLSTPPDGATNVVLVGHGFNVSSAAGVSIAEGAAAIFRPAGDGRFTVVATVTSREWEDLVAAS